MTTKARAKPRGRPKAVVKGKTKKPEKTYQTTSDMTGREKEPIHLKHFFFLVRLSPESKTVTAGVGICKSSLYKIVNYGYVPLKPVNADYQEKIIAWIEKDGGRAKAAAKYREICGLKTNKQLFDRPTKPVDESRLATMRAGLTDKPRDENETVNVIWSVEAMRRQTKKFFGLKQNPFVEDVMEAADVFLTKDWNEIFDDLKDVAEVGGFRALIGESGSGKSILRERLEDDLQDGGLVRVVKPMTLDQKKITPYTLLTAILADLGVKGGNQSEEMMARRAYKALVERLDNHKRTVLIIEDAQRLNNDTLYLLKGFIEQKHNYKPLLGIILIAQPELAAKLDEELNFSLRQTIRRIGILKMPALNGSTEKYLEFKFARIGVKLSKIITQDGIRAILDHWTRYDTVGRRKRKRSQCYPLTVGNTLVRAMNYCAAISGSKIVKADDVFAALRPQG